jgi:undecaprenyl-diphosphatase
MSLLQSLLDLDQKLTRRLQVAEKPGKRRFLFILLAHSGDSWFWLAGLGLVWWLGDTAWRQWALVVGFSILVTAVVVLAVKFTVRRRRPEGKWGDVYRKTDPHSFPSGHAARAFVLAVMAFWLGPPWLGWILMIWAPMVTLARVAMGVHYLSDVLAGALCGVLLAWGLVGVIPHLPFLA